MSDVMVIGLAGGTGSGKTTITKKLMQRFGGDVSVILRWILIFSSLITLLISISNSFSSKKHPR